MTSFPVVGKIAEKAGIKFEITRDDGELEQAVLAVKQKFLVAYSNGLSPTSARATVEFLAEYQSEHAIADMTELTAALKQSAEADGAANLLFQLLCERASREQNELLAHEAWTTLDDQEPEHLPASITGQDGVGGFGLANERAYFSIIKPLTEFIQNQSMKQHCPRAVSSCLWLVGWGNIGDDCAEFCSSMACSGLLLEQKIVLSSDYLFDQTAPKSDSLDQFCKQTAKFWKLFLSTMGSMVNI